MSASPDSASAYRQFAAFGASAVGQVIALYDAILRDFHRAVAAIEAGQIEQRVNAANHALIVIGELQGVLDFARGGQAARRLNSFYNVTRAMTTEAAVMNSRKKFQELISMFARLRAAWSQVERTVYPSQPTERLRICSSPQATFPQKDPPPENSGSSGGGGWSA
jgi:flagellar biosynthetic protein FliS